MKCDKCGASVPLWLTHVGGKCAKCYPPAWEKLSAAAKDIYLPDAYLPTATEFTMEYPVEYPGTFLNFPGDRVLSEIGRAFDDAIDLAYLG